MKQISRRGTKNEPNMEKALGKQVPSSATRAAVTCVCYPKFRYPASHAHCVVVHKQLLRATKGKDWNAVIELIDNGAPIDARDKVARARNIRTMELRI